MSFLTVLILISGFSFLFYAYTLLVNSEMKVEFERYGLEKYRRLTGYLQLFGGLGLLIGLKFPVLLIASSACLSVLMLMGFGVRLKIRDGIYKSAPSFMFMLLNLLILVKALHMP